MKLHLPTSLRAALLATLFFSASVQAGSITYENNEYYYTGADHDDNNNCYWRYGSSVWIDPEKTSIKDANGKSHDYDNSYIFDYQLIFTITSHHTCELIDGLIKNSKVEYTYQFTGNEDGLGKDITWNCSTNGTPGVWILATEGVTSAEKPIVFRNYGNMIVDGSQQAYYLVKASDYDENGNVIYTKTLKYFHYDSPNEVGYIDPIYDSPADVSTTEGYLTFDLLVEDTASFTFRNGLTGSEGVLTNNAEVVRFNNVGEVAFADNTMLGSVGGIVYETDFYIDGATKVSFSGNTGTTSIAAYQSGTTDGVFSIANVSGEVKFTDNSSTNLFYNSNVLFEHVGKVLIVDNSSRVLRLGNGRGVLSFNDCGEVVVEDNITASHLLISSFSSADVLSFVGCDRISISGNTYDDSLVKDSPINMENVGDVVISGNKVSAGKLLGSTALTVKGLSGSLTVDGNEMTQSDSYINAALNSGNVSISGAGEGTFRAKSFNISNTTSSGKFYYALTSETLSVSHVESLGIQSNTAALTGAKGFMNVLTLADVEDALISNNKITSDAACASFIGKTSIDACKTLSVCKNIVTSKSGVVPILFSNLTVTNAPKGASIDISNNELSGTLTGNRSIQTVTITGVDSFAFENNISTLNPSSSTAARQYTGIFNGATTLTDVGTIKFNGNKTVNEVAENGFTSETSGGVIKAKLQIDNAQSIEFIGNEAIATGEGAEAKGGALYTGGGYIQNAGSVVFRRNKAIGSVGAYGGAIDFNYTSSLTLNTGLGELIFEDNVAQASEAQGGAFYVDSSGAKRYTADVLKMNRNSVIATGTDAKAYGGAVSAYCELKITGCETAEINYNSVLGTNLTMTRGGAIYSDAKVTIGDIGMFTMRGNSISDGKCVRLQGIYTVSSGVYLQANEDQHLTFYDSIRAGERLSLNSETDNTGTITFSGQYTEEDLSRITNSYTQEDLAASRLIEALHL